MMTMIATAAARQVTSSSSLFCRLTRAGTRLASGSGHVKIDPSRYVTGIKASDVENDPVLSAYFAANFPEQDEEPTVAAVGEDKDQEEASEDEVLRDETLERLNIRPLSCYKRDTVEEEGSRRCRRMRRLDLFIPGLLYGGDPTKGIHATDPDSKVFVKTPWNLLHRELDRYHRNFESRVYDLTLYEDVEDTEGTVHRVVARDVQRHPVQSKIHCANYLRYFPGRPVKLPFVYVNEEESPALKRDGYVVPISRHLECVIEDGVPIPEHLEIECTGLRLRECIRMDRIILPDGVTPSRSVDQETFLVGPIFGKGSDEPEEEEEAAEKEAGGE